MYRQPTEALTKRNRFLLALCLSTVTAAVVALPLALQSADNGSEPETPAASAPAPTLLTRDDLGLGGITEVDPSATSTTIPAEATTSTEP